MNVLYAVSEAAPFIKTGGLADVAGSLPKALCECGTDTRVILPLYSSISQKWRDKMEFLFYTNVHLSWRTQYCGLYMLEYEGVCYYFVDNEYYFKRDGVYGYYDDAERFGFFSRAIIELLPLLGWKPNVINCNDWQTSLVPIYIKREPADFYKNIKTVLTIHNIEYQGRFPLSTLDDVFGLSTELYDSGILRFDNDVCLLKGALYEADFITTVSPSYAYELKDAFFACGLSNVIEENSYKLKGILNGIDITRYDPESDNLIPAKFDVNNPEGKKLCKIALCKELGLDETNSGPIISCVSRLVGHKGFDLVRESLDAILARGARLVILGTGDNSFETFFKEEANKYPGRVSANIMYSEKRAMLIYSGADMLLMPSMSEPCGLSQMIAMRYGTIPIVRRVGGLRDSIRNYRSENSNGFTFDDYSASAMLGAVDDALNTFQNHSEWQALMYRAMSDDLSWESSALEYIKTYNQILG